MYYKIIHQGHIVQVGIGASEHQIQKDEYERILDVIRQKPIPEEGYDYFLKEDMSWEYLEVPEVQEDATAKDYESALSELGVNV